MAKIRGDPHTIALAHDTRARLYDSLCEKEEMSTVDLEKKLKVTRYHLYHHLRQLAKIGLIENHRDIGRAKWWRVIRHVPTSSATTSSSTEASSFSDWIGELPHEMRAMLEGGAKLEFYPLPKTASSSINAKKMLETIAMQHGIDLNIPFTFIPGGIVLISQPR